MVCLVLSVVLVWLHDGFPKTCAHTVLLPFFVCLLRIPISKRKHNQQTSKLYLSYYGIKNPGGMHHSTNQCRLSRRAQWFVESTALHNLLLYCVNRILAFSQPGDLCDPHALTDELLMFSFFIVECHSHNSLWSSFFVLCFLCITHTKHPNGKRQGEEGYMERKNEKCQWASPEATPSDSSREGRSETEPLLQ